MTERCCISLACVAWLLVACGGTKAPAESPADHSPAAEEDTTPQAELESGPLTTVEDEVTSSEEVSKQELPCPGERARYWDTGLVRSEVLTGDCEINGQSFPVGTLLEFDEEGQLLTE